MVALLYGLGVGGLEVVVSRGVHGTDRAQAGFDRASELLAASSLHALNQLFHTAIRPNTKANALLRHRTPASWWLMLASSSRIRSGLSDQPLFHQHLQTIQQLRVFQLFQRRAGVLAHTGVAIVQEGL